METKEEIIWEYISKLSELRSNYDCFDKKEEPYYKALSAGIQALKNEIKTEKEGK